MTREEIKKAAQEKVERLANIAYAGGGHIGQDDLETVFVCGAEWRINSVWHDVSERPDERRAVIIEYGENRISLHEKGYDGPWIYNVEQFGFKRWAYIEDLLPNMEE